MWGPYSLMLKICLETRKRNQLGKRERNQQLEDLSSTPNTRKAMFLGKEHATADQASA